MRAGTLSRQRIWVGDRIDEMDLLGLDKGDAAVGDG